MPFALSPAGAPTLNFSVAAADTPSGEHIDGFIEWQLEGVAMGDRQVDVIDFVGDGIRASRGVGANSNVVTIELSEDILVAAPAPPPPPPPPPAAHGCYISDDFEAGIGAYSLISGSAALFTAVPDDYGNALRCAAQNSGTPSRIRRTFAAVTATRVVMRVRVDTDGPDDAASIALLSGGTAPLVVVPRRETVFDASRRCWINLDGDAVLVSGALAIGDWHEIVIALAPGAGQSSYTVTNLASATTVASGTFASDVPSLSVDGILFDIDSGGLTCATSYDDLCVGF